MAVVLGRVSWRVCCARKNIVGILILLCLVFGDHLFLNQRGIRGLLEQMPHSWFSAADPASHRHTKWVQPSGVAAATHAPNARMARAVAAKSIKEKALPVSYQRDSEEAEDVHTAAAGRRRFLCKHFAELKSMSKKEDAQCSRLDAEANYPVTNMDRLILLYIQKMKRAWYNQPGIHPLVLAEGTAIAALRYGGRWDDDDIDWDGVLPEAGASALRPGLEAMKREGFHFLNELTRKVTESADEIIASLDPNKNLFLTYMSKAEDDTAWSTVHFYAKMPDGSYATRGPGQYIAKNMPLTMFTQPAKCTVYGETVHCPGDHRLYFKLYGDVAPNRKPEYGSRCSEVAVPLTGKVELKQSKQPSMADLAFVAKRMVLMEHCGFATFMTEPSQAYVKNTPGHVPGKRCCDDM